jgi:sarcosine oxidase, subunit gamma
MVESYLRQSPLAPLGLLARAAADADAGVTLCERPFRHQVNLRGDAAVAKAAGIALPTKPNTASENALWLGPDEWLITGDTDPAPALREALKGLHATVTDVSEARAVIGLSGPHARDVLAKGCPLDLHPREFGLGRCAQSILAQAAVILHQKDAAPTYDIYVARSYAGYLWAWLEDAAAEYGLAVSAG